MTASQIGGLKESIYFPISIQHISAQGHSCLLPSIYRGTSSSLEEVISELLWRRGRHRKMALIKVQVQATVLDSVGIGEAIARCCLSFGGRLFFFSEIK